MTINDQIRDEKLQYGINREAAKISALSSNKIRKYEHGVIILNRINNSEISIETSAPQQAGAFIIKYYFGISNITKRKNNPCPIMFHCAKICVSCWLSHNN